MSSKPIKRNEKNLFTEADFTPESTKERITTLIDEDVVDWLRAEAKKTGIGYQTFMNMQLRSLMNASLAKRKGKSLSFVEEMNPNQGVELTKDFMVQIGKMIDERVERKIRTIESPHRKKGGR